MQRNVERKSSECDICHKMYKNLSSHKNFAHKKDFECDECDETFAYKNVLEIHIGRKHLVSREVPCVQCNKKFFNKHDLKDHITQVHNEERPFKCDECELTFKRSSNYHTHKKTHKDTKDFECPICHKTFKNKSSIARCINTHNLEGQSFPCHVATCDAVLKSPDLVRGHFLRVHSEKAATISFPCTVCTKTFKSNSDLKRHTNKVHLKLEKPFKCSVCPRKCYTEKELERHVNIHSGETFSCWYEGCSSKSNTKYGINHHYKKKHGQVKHRPGYVGKDTSKRAPCDLCGFMVKSGNSLVHSMKLHKEKHNAQIAINCPVSTCSIKIFTSKTSYSFPLPLYSHIETVHEVPLEQFVVDFTCKICSEKVTGRCIGDRVTFADKWKTNMKKHIKIHHKETLPGLKVFAEDWKKYFECEEMRFEDLGDQLFHDKDNVSLNEKLNKIENIVEEVKLSVENYQRMFLDILNRVPVVNLEQISIH